MSKEKMVSDALALFYALRRETNGVGEEILATLMVAQAVDRLTALLTPVVTEPMLVIEEEKAARAGQK